MQAAQSRSQADDNRLGRMILQDDENDDSALCDHLNCEHGLDIERPELCWEHWEQRQQERKRGDR